MGLTQGMASGRSRPWQGQAWVQVMAVVLGVAPLYASLVTLQLRGGATITLQGFIFYLAVICPLSIVVALLLLRFLCGESLRDLNLRPGRVLGDLVATLLLSVGILIASVISTHFLAQLFPDSASNRSVTNLFVQVAGNPRLLVLFVGLLLFLGAVSEEVVRAFLLSRLWKIWPSTPGKLAAVLVSAFFFGLIHLYQGPVHAAWTAIFALIMALYYLRSGRVVPLILAHYLTNAIQVVLFVARGR
jgi:membrane protease YdiL (CAAX protease family)